MLNDQSCDFGSFLVFLNYHPQRISGRYHKFITSLDLFIDETAALILFVLPAFSFHQN